MTNHMTKIDRRSKVKNSILDHLVGRGVPPRGWSEEQLFADYISALGDYPAPVLEAAAKQVRLEHTRNTWPLAGDFLKVVKTLMADEPVGVKHQVTSDLDRSRRAHDYATRRLLADGAALYLRAAKCMALPVVRQWLFDQACACMRRGGDPHTSDIDLEEQLVAWETAWAPIAGAAEKEAKDSTFGDSARGLVDQARDSHEGGREP